LRELRQSILIVLSIFALTLLGAYLSPTFEEQKGFLELFFLMGSLLFIFSLMVLLAHIGLSSFALYMALVVALVMGLFGVVAAFLVVFVSYMIWGFIFAIELLLVGSGVESAKEWFAQRYTFESFYLEYRVFYLMILVVYFLVELLPSFLGLEKPKRFTPREIIEEMRRVLR
jgi:hypothetical protein